MSEGLTEAGAKLLFQWVRPSERKRGKKSELIPVAGSSARHGPTYLSRNVELIYFQNSDQKVATLLHGGVLQEKYRMNLKVQSNGLPNIANISCCDFLVKFAQMQKVITSNLHLGQVENGMALVIATQHCQKCHSRHEPHVR